MNKLTALLLAMSSRQSLQTLVQLLDAIGHVQTSASIIPNAVNKTSLTKPSPLENIIVCVLHNNCFEIKRMYTTVCTRHSSSPLLQIGMPGNEAIHQANQRKCPKVHPLICWMIQVVDIAL